MTDFIDKKIGEKKSQLLDYYRSRGEELAVEIKEMFGETQYKEKANAVNKGMIETKLNLLKILEQQADKENWSNKDKLKGVLMITYTNYVAMMEARNEVWLYEYMTFARRIGELWEPFCQLCWDYPVNPKISLFIPPLFRDVKNKLTKEIEGFIEKLKISPEERNELKKYYQKVWLLVSSGEVKLELDLHFQDEKYKHNVDFKSGFSSNEKGNTNRLLLVASVYKILEENYVCSLFVRSAEERNNHYLQTLKHSGLWNVYCGEEAYKQIGTHTGFNLQDWIKKNVQWDKDFNEKMYSHLNNTNLIQYLEW